MKPGTFAVLALVAPAPSAHALGLDRSGQGIRPLFEDGNYAEFAFSRTAPSLSGAGLPTAGGAATGNVGRDFTQVSGAIKYQFSDTLSMALIADEPFGADIFYGGNPALTILGGTAARVDGFALTALVRYKFNDNVSVHGGLRYQTISADVTLGGLAFGGLNGYNAGFGSDGDTGFVIGAAYEIPDIALRVSLTYNSRTTHDLPTTETLGGVNLSLLPFGLPASSTTRVETPESLNLLFQTGIAADTLLFGAVRYARYSGTRVVPIGFDTLNQPTVPGNSLTDLEDGFDVSLGLGRKFSERWSGQISVGFTTEGQDDLVSPLGPNNGSRYVALGARYNLGEDVAISGGVRYTRLGDAFSAPGGNPVAAFRDNEAVSVGFRVSFQF